MNYYLVQLHYLNSNFGKFLRIFQEQHTTAVRRTKNKELIAVKGNYINSKIFEFQIFFISWKTLRHICRHT